VAKNKKKTIYGILTQDSQAIGVASGLFNGSLL